MKIFFGLVLLVPFTLSLAAAEAQGPAETAEADELVSMWNIRYPEADQLLDRVLATMPKSPIQLDAELRTKQYGGNFEAVAAVSMMLNASGNSGLAVYSVSDVFGSGRERLQVRRSLGQVSHDYRVGDPPEEKKFPGLDARIRETELTWGDLTLSFLWWRGGTTLGRDKVRGRSCYIVELPAPEPASGPVRSVRVWIDPKIGMLLRADSFSTDGELIRSLSVKKFRKIDEVWMVSHVGVTTYPSKASTSLLIQDVSTLDPESAGTGPALSSVQ